MWCLTGCQGTGRWRTAESLLPGTDCWPPPVVRSCDHHTMSGDMQNRCALLYIQALPMVMNVISYAYQIGSRVIHGLKAYISNPNCKLQLIL